MENNSGDHPGTGDQQRGLLEPGLPSGHHPIDSIDNPSNFPSPRHYQHTTPHHHPTPPLPPFPTANPYQHPLGNFGNSPQLNPYLPPYFAPHGLPPPGPYGYNGPLLTALGYASPSFNANSSHHHLFAPPPPPPFAYPPPPPPNPTHFAPTPPPAVNVRPTSSQPLFGLRTPVTSIAPPNFASLSLPKPPKKPSELTTDNPFKTPSSCLPSFRTQPRPLPSLHTPIRHTPSHPPISKRTPTPSPNSSTPVAPSGVAPLASSTSNSRLALSPLNEGFEKLETRSTPSSSPSTPKSSYSVPSNSSREGTPKSPYSIPSNSSREGTPGSQNRNVIANSPPSLIINAEESLLASDIDRSTPSFSISPSSTPLNDSKRKRIITVRPNPVKHQVPKSASGTAFVSSFEEPLSKKNKISSNIASMDYVNPSPCSGRDPTKPGFYGSGSSSDILRAKSCGLTGDYSCSATTRDSNSNMEDVSIINKTAMELHGSRGHNTGLFTDPSHSRIPRISSTMTDRATVTSVSTGSDVISRNGSTGNASFDGSFCYSRSGFSNKMDLSASPVLTSKKTRLASKNIVSASAVPTGNHSLRSPITRSVLKKSFAAPPSTQVCISIDSSSSPHKESEKPKSSNFMETSENFFVAIAENPIVSTQSNFSFTSGASYNARTSSQDEVCQIPYQGASNNHLDFSALTAPGVFKPNPGTPCFGPQSQTLGELGYETRPIRANSRNKGPKSTSNVGDQINAELGPGFYNEFRWIDRTKEMCGPDEYATTLLSMGNSHLNVPPFLSTAMPREIRDRVGWAVRPFNCDPNDSALVVGKSMAFANTFPVDPKDNVNTVNRCLVCDGIVATTLNIVMFAFIMRIEDSAGKRALYGPLKSLACYMHFQSPSSINTGLNIYKNPGATERFWSRLVNDGYKPPYKL